MLKLTILRILFLTCNVLFRLFCSVVSDDERSFALAINSFAGNLIGESLCVALWQSIKAVVSWS